MKIDTPVKADSKADPVKRNLPRIEVIIILAVSVIVFLALHVMGYVWLKTR